MEFVTQKENGLEAWQRHYLTHNISYTFDKDKREAMQLFFQWAALLEVVPATR